MLNRARSAFERIESRSCFSEGIVNSVLHERIHREVEHGHAVVMAAARPLHLGHRTETTIDRVDIALSLH
jgi:hypothetical protein